jgi:endonuclease/exonuclease/phosphatase family metal-dependent hydrolase
MRTISRFVLPTLGIAILLTGCPTPDPKLSVPNVMGMVRTNAENAIEAAGLAVGGITEQYHDTVPSGRVISQNPPPDTMVSPGSAVALVISKGPAHDSYGDSVKILTFNVRMIPETWDDFCCDISNGSRAKLIGDVLRTKDYDIIVLNEVFDEDSKDGFVSRLAGIFPHYVRKIDKPTDMEDSGLMLFSRFPFEPLPNPDWMLSFDPLVATPFIEAYSNGQIAWANVAAIVYPTETCYDYDCDSAKGVGLVRVRNPETNHIMNVAFSHTQASYGGGDCRTEVDGRAMQFDLAQQLLEVVLGNRVATEPVFMLGDLNVNGDQKYCWNSGSDFGYVHGEPCAGENLWEWTTLFGTPGAFFTDMLGDSWVYEMQGPNYYGNDTVDRGLTLGLPVPGERVDYVLWNRSSRYQIQHLTREHSLRILSGYVMSDHIPICADYNLESAGCSPMTARAPVQDAINTGNIAHPGSMQWYRIDEPGTYLVSVTGDDIAFSVYESKDLTSPAPQYYNETGTFQVQVKPPVYVTAPKFVLPEAPFYIRVYKTARNLTGPYDLAVHRMTGESKEEAISLLPGAVWLEYEWPGVPLNGDDCVWFKLRIDTADNPLAQHTMFKLANYIEDWVSLALEREDGDIIDKDDVAEPYVGSTLSLTIERNDLGTTPEILYLRAFREYVWAMTFLIGWDTNLTVLHGLWALPGGVPGAAQEMLVCHTETDGGIDDLDETYITVTVDGKVVVNDQWMMQFDDDYNYDLENVLATRKFVGSVQVTLREDDDGGYGEDDWFDYAIGPLPFWTREAMGQAQGDMDEDEAGEYSISYNLSRTLQQLPVR